jgi:cytochrome c oxidase subunit 2
MSRLNRCRLCRLAPLAAALVAGCSHDVSQSTLHPAGPAAAAIAWLWWVMLAAFTGVFFLVLVVLCGAIFRGPKRVDASDARVPRRGSEPPLGRNGFIIAGGIVLPIVILTPLFLFSLQTSASLRQPPEALTIRVVGHMWWWEVRYPEQGIVTANEIHIPVGKPVRLELASADVIHSFWVPRLGGKRDMIPGIENTFWIQADKPGVYRGQCGEYCGTQHANMAFHVVALPPEEFAGWLSKRNRRRGAAAMLEDSRGFQIFMSAGCGECHAIHGTRAKGNVGPDLTHFGSRRTIGAAMLESTRANLTGWIADPQAIKPGIRMPRTYLPAQDLLDLATFLEEQE